MPASSPPAPVKTTATLSPDERFRWDSIVALIAVGVIALDQITKALVIHRFQVVFCHSLGCPTNNGDVVSVFGNVLTFIYLPNTGTAFSLAEGSPLVYLLIAIAVSVIGWLYWTTRSRQSPWLKSTFGLIIGGAIGNLIDRARFGSVVDFIHFQLPNFNYPVFNVADSAVVVGMITLATLFWLNSPKEGQREQSAIESADATNQQIQRTSSVASSAPPAQPHITASTMSSTRPSATTKTTPTSVAVAQRSTPRSSVAIAQRPTTRTSIKGRNKKKR